MVTTKKSAGVTGLDDVEMLHKGKGHAADIHANHTTDEEPEEEEERPAKKATGKRGAASKKVVHFVDDMAAGPSGSPAKSGTGKVTKTKAVSVRLQREPMLDTMVVEALQAQNQMT